MSDHRSTLIRVVENGLLQGGPEVCRRTILDAPTMVDAMPRVYLVDSERNPKSGEPNTWGPHGIEERECPLEYEDLERRAVESGPPHCSWWFLYLRTNKRWYFFARCLPYASRDVLSGDVSRLRFRASFDAGVSG